MLAEANRRLQQERCEECRTFNELIQSISRSIGSIHGIGELTIYDIATRIGAFLGLEPDRVYLHSGTWKGAEVLLPCRRLAFLMPEELPPAFGRLKPREIEECLCIYKRDLARIAPRREQVLEADR